MTNRERILAVIRGEELDKVPFVQYAGMAPNEEAWALLGRDNLGLIAWVHIEEFVSPNCSFESGNTLIDGKEGLRTVLRTPAGNLIDEKLYEPAYRSLASKKHFIIKPEDYKILIAYLKDVQVREKYENYFNNEKALGDDGVPMVSVERTPYQQLWVQWVGINDLCEHIVDYPELIEEVVGLLAEKNRKIFRIMEKAVDSLGIPFVDFPDNITAPVIGEKYFKKYCLPLYNELADMLEEKNVPIYVHADGDLKPLWKAIGESKVRGLDSFSPVPDNDTSVAEALSVWKDMKLHINFPSSVHIAEPAEIYSQAMKILEEGGNTGRILIQVSENVPPNVWKTSYPWIVKAINDFGKPGK